MNSLQQIIQQTVPPDMVAFNEPMSCHTSFKIGGPADVLLTPGTMEELLSCLQIIKEYRLPHFFLGGGTNILVSDKGIRGVIIHTGKLNRISTTADGTLTAQAGAQVEHVCNAAAESGLSGLEFICGMPGSIGGALWMNARCYGGSLSDILDSATVITRNFELETVQYNTSDFGYKRSPFQTMQGCIWDVTLKLSVGDQGEIRSKMSENQQDRKEKGHYSYPSAGSLFKNNREFGAPTGRILDDLGLKGKRIGGAAIAPYHANIFINENNATACDVLSLIRLAVETAFEKKQLRLEPEVRLVGEWQREELAFLHT